MTDRETITERSRRTADKRAKRYARALGPSDTEQSAVATLRALLSEIEGGEERLQDEMLGRLICALHGVPISAYWTQNGSFWVETSDRKRFCDGLVWHSFTNHRPDTNLQAADDLCRECGFLRSSGDNLTSSEAYKVAEVFRKKPWRYASANHPNNEPRAILAALVRARIAELEAANG